MAPHHEITTSPSDSPITTDTPVTSWWNNLNFEAVDVLNVSPFIVDLSNKNGDFILADEAHKGDSAIRLAWVINRARLMNPKIKIIGMQFWGTTAIANLKDEKQIHNYVNTVAKVVEEWTLDGYDIDYERNDSPPLEGNVIPKAPEVLHLIRQKLDALSKHLKRPLYVTISPATTECLVPDRNPIAKKYPVKDSVHFVNVQTYDGGRNENNTIESWLELGFHPNQLLYGMCPEQSANRAKECPTFSEAEDKFTKYGLAGINSWRLTGNQAFSNAVQAVIYKFLHPTANIKLPATKEALDAIWYDATAQGKVLFP